MKTILVKPFKYGIEMHLKKTASKSIALVVFLIFSFVSYSQTITSSLPDSVIEQRLIDLAMKGPEVEKVQHQYMVNEYQLKAARFSWLNFLTFSANFNEQSISSVPATYVYPRYNFGINIPIGTIISSKQGKIAKENLTISTLLQEEAKRKVKTDVVGKYRQYKAQGEILKINTTYLNDLQVSLTQADDKFKKNDLSFEAYNLALKNRNDQQVKVIQLRLDQDLTKLEIERLIGTTLESVLK